jgi:4-diphosphocytidyl-2C-methyl-D-erythritol kinase
MAAKEFDSPMADGGGSYAPTHVGTTVAPPNRITLYLGVVDMPYANHQAPAKIAKAKKGKQNKPIKPKSEAATKTTGEVAEILEEKYGVLDSFVFAHMPDIAKVLEESIAGELETLMMGGRVSGNPLQSAESSITTMMKKFISAQEIEHTGIEGVPTQAALNGVNHRLKHPYAKKNPRRPSFMDTTLYWQSLRAWFK